MAIDFPSSPTDGQVFYPPNGPIYVYRSAKGAWTRNRGTANTRNILVNPSMQISQQNGNTSSTATAYYLADQWQSSAGQNHTWQRVAAATPSGSPYRLRVVSGTAITNTQMSFLQNIEGYRIADLAYGTANAKYSVLRFGMKGPAGAYACSFQHYTANYSTIVFGFDLPDQVDTVFTFVVPPGTIDSWPIDNGYQVQFFISPAMTDAAKTPNVGVWQSAQYSGKTGMSNGADTVGKTFEIFDVGWYADPNMTGRAPEFQKANYEDDLAESQRYWYKATGLRGLYNTTTTSVRNGAPHPVPMRITPTQALVGATLRLYDQGSVQNVTAVANTSSSSNHCDLSITPAAAQIQYRRSMLLADAQEAQYIALSAR